MRRLLGEVLLAAGFICREQLNEALLLQKDTRERIGQVLLRMGCIREIDLAKGLALQMNLAFVDLNDIEFLENAGALLPQETARRYNILPFKSEGGKLHIVMSDPTDFYAIEAVRAVCGRELEIGVAAKRDIQQRLPDAYRQGGKAAAQSGKKADGTALPVIGLVDEVIKRAIEERASDIHIEPLEDAFRVRFRVDGILREAFSLEKDIQPALISRVKIMGALDIAEKRMPQDGRSRYCFGGGEIDLRISTLPTIFGEKVVIRILNRAHLITEIGALGFSKENLDFYRRMCRRDHGMILLAGPTGSGKSTTLYATLLELNDAKKNIVTIENPVEYRLKGINQAQINEKAGLTFGACLRAVLRQDPDVIMVGEIRDKETAEISVRASLTGHMVFSTIHTASAAGTVFRLLDMGIEPFLLASSLLGIAAQRLVRVICPDCKVAYHPLPDSPEQRLLGEFYTDGLLLYRGSGCRNCAGTGYKGRIAVNEVLYFDKALQENFMRDCQRRDFRALLEQKCKKSMFADGMEKVMQGVTTMEEVLLFARAEGR